MNVSRWMPAKIESDIEICEGNRQEIANETGNPCDVEYSGAIVNYNDVYSS